MAAWLPILKAALPYVAQIVTAAIPAFTAKSDASKADPIVAQQIEELQTAATKNAESIHILADQLQHTIQGIETAVTGLERQVLIYKKLLFASLSISVVALALVGWTAFRAAL